MAPFAVLAFVYIVGNVSECAALSQSINVKRDRLRRTQCSMSSVVFDEAVAMAST